MKRWIWLLVWVVTIAGFLWLSKPFLNPRYFMGHDSEAHVTRTAAYFSAWKEGQFPVRWIGWVFGDAGSPFFSVYPVGFYMTVAALMQAGVPYMWSFQGFIWLAWFTGGIGAALLMKRWGPLSSWVAAVSYWLAPYIATDLFIRSANPELAAISASLFGWWAWDRWLTTRKVWAALMSALFFALVLLFHVPTALVMFPLYLIYTCLYAGNFRDRRFVARTVLLGVVVLGLSAFYIIPSLTELPLIRSSDLKAGWYDYSNHFLAWRQLFTGTWHYGYSNPGTDNDMSFAQAPGQWAILLLAVELVIWLVIKRKTGNEVRQQLLFWIGVSIVALLLCLQPFNIIWDRLPVLGYLQYPWRLLMVFTIAISVMAGILVSYLKQWYFRLFIMLLIAGGMI